MLNNGRQKSKDLAAAADLIFDSIKEHYEVLNQIPSRVELVKQMGNDFGFGVNDSVLTLRLMESRYSGQLKDKGYNFLDKEAIKSFLKQKG